MLIFLLIVREDRQAKEEQIGRKEGGTERGLSINKLILLIRASEWYSRAMCSAYAGHSESHPWRTYSLSEFET